MPRRGFLPCFSKYLFSVYPIENMYTETSHVDKVKKLLSALIEILSPVELKNIHGIGKEIQPIRPDSQEGKRLIAQCSFGSSNLYRIDYGDTPFRVIFGLSNQYRQAYIFGIDTNHKSFSGKHKK